MYPRRASQLTSTDPSHPYRIIDQGEVPHLGQTLVYSQWAISLTTVHQTPLTIRGWSCHQFQHIFSFSHYPYSYYNLTNQFGWFTCGGRYTLSLGFQFNRHHPQSTRASLKVSLKPLMHSSSSKTNTP